MLEHPAPGEISSAAQRVYHDLPSANILGSNVKPQAAFISSTETITTVLTNIAKIGALASLPFGILLLNSYLRSEGAPLPAADTSISVLLSLVCVIFLFLTLVLASVFLLPTFAKISRNSKSEMANDSFHRKKKRVVVRQKVKLIGREYYLHFGPFLSFVLFAFFAVCLVENNGWRWIGPTIGLASFAVYCSVWYVSRYRNFDDVLQSSFLSLPSFMVLFLVTLAVIGQLNPHMHALGVAFWSVGIPFGIHAFMVTLVTNWKTALAVYVVILLLSSIMWPGSGFLGGLTLRYAGIGGGIPVSIRLKTYSGTGTVSGSNEMTGCLVLMTGGDVLIRPTDRIMDCKLHPQYMGGQSLIETYSRVDRYARADVLRVSKFPTSCGTTDGLPSC